MIRIQILFLILFMLILSNIFADSVFEFNLGGGAFFPVSTISNFYNGALNINAKFRDKSLPPMEREEIVKQFSDLVNISKSGVRYGIYSQFGAKFDDFISVGLELIFDMNFFSAINKYGIANDNFSFIMGIAPRLYTKLDFFVMAIAFFTGPKVNKATSITNSVLEELGVISWDIGARLSCSFLILEGCYNWNVKSDKFSDFKFGLGFEFGIV